MSMQPCCTDSCTRSAAGAARAARAAWAVWAVWAANNRNTTSNEGRTGYSDSGHCELFDEYRRLAVGLNGLHQRRASIHRFIFPPSISMGLSPALKIPE